MPFRSEKQRRFLWLKHPDIAQRWANEAKMGTNRTFTNMLNQKQQGKKVLKEEKKPNLWAKMLKKG